METCSFESMELAAAHVAPLLRDLRRGDSDIISVTFTAIYGYVKVEIFRDGTRIATILDEVEE